MWEDFKKFAFEGNVLDLAVAVIIGTAFGKIVSSLVEDIMMPLIGALFNGVDFSNLTWMIGSAPIAYGMFIQSVFDFLVIAGSILDRKSTRLNSSHVAISYAVFCLK